jgi:hypothetical protein
VTDFDPATGDLVVDYRLGPQVLEPPRPPDIFVLGPDGFQQPMPIQKIGARSYRGRLAIGDRQGLFRVRPLVESAAFRETGFYREERELSEFGNDPALLAQIASYTGGRVNPEPRAVFDPGGRSVASTLQLWPALVGLAILLNLAELVLRKWAGLPFRQAS